MSSNPPVFFGARPADDIPKPATLTASRPAPPPTLITAPPIPMRAPLSSSPAVQEHSVSTSGGTTQQLSLNQLLRWIARANASDLHLAAGRVPAARINGDLAPIEGLPPLTGEQLKEMLFAIMNERHREQFQTHRDVDLSYELDATARFRVNVFQQQGQISAVMRLIPVRIRTAEEMKLPEAITRLASLPRGLVLVTGPTGSGKSTLLASLIDLANRSRRAHIVTIEDPVEFTHKPLLATISQRQVGEDTDSFAAALKHVLRQDPDIILVGEMRDLETTAIALSAAETGHLVFATLHTQSAPETVSRVIDMFPAGQQQQVRSQLAACLQAVVTQTLVKQLNGNGREAAREVMIFDTAVRNIIREGKLEQLPSKLQTGGDLGSHTLNADLARLVIEGKVSYEEAAQAASDITELNSKTRRSTTGRP